MPRSLLRAALAGLGLAAAPSALAGDVAGAPPPEAAAQYRTGRTLGTTGMAMGYGGPVLVGVGGVILLTGATNSAGSLLSGGNGVQGVNQAIGGAAVMLGGWGAAAIGPAILASGSLIGANGVSRGGGSTSKVAGWVAVGGSGLQLATLAGRFAGSGGNGGGLTALGIAGWGTAMVAGTIQHVRNRSGWESLGSAALPTERKRFAVSLVPTGRGAALLGTF